MSIESSAFQGALAHVDLLKRRPRYLSLDWAPFAIVYGIGLGDIAASVFKTGWEIEANIRNSIQLFIVIVLHILLWLFCHWNVKIQAVVRYLPAKRIQQADAVLVRMKGYSSKRVLVPLLHRRLMQSNRGDYTDEFGFEVAFQHYVYNSDKDSFEKLSYPIHEPLDWYIHHKGFANKTDLTAATANWGPNLFEVSIPKFSTLLIQQLLAPFFVFQVFCIGLWCLDEYWIYSVSTLGMMVVFEGTVAGQRLRNLHHLRSLQSAKQPTSVYRSGKWERIPGELLLPGDVVSVGRLAHGHDEVVIPADMVLISGTCIVDESVLTGESTPQWKSPLSTALEGDCTQITPLDLKRDKPHILFGGTKCIQHTMAKDSHIKYAHLLAVKIGLIEDMRRSPDGGCLAVVIRTGFETAQGNLMGTILHASEHVTTNNWETGIYIFFLLCFALAASGYVLYHGLQDGNRSRFKLFLNCTTIITSVIPLELPMELSIAVNQSLIRLLKKRIFCTEPFRIPFAGKVQSFLAVMYPALAGNIQVDVCCFDKTGTLTDDSMILDGVAETASTKKSEIVEPTELSSESTRVLASCHSLVVVDGDLIGDPLEIAAFKAIGWSYRSDLAIHPKKSEELIILHRYHFSAQLKRMSAVVRCRPAIGGVTNIVVSKGAPEIMHSRFINAPLEYTQLHKRYASQGGRIIALGYRFLDPSQSEDDAAMRGSNRDVAENNLEFAGFAVFQCPLKEESEPTLRMLKESSHQLVMITGDAPLTACNAARHVHIITRPVLILYSTKPDSTLGTPLRESDLVWLNPEETERIPFATEKEAILKLAIDWDLCITGEVFPFLEQRCLSRFVLPLIQVFARVAPEHKEQVVDSLKSEGRVVLMCGDGTNDVGGLKAAHCGVALLTDYLRKVKQLEHRRKGDRSRQASSSAQRRPSVECSRVEMDGNPAQRMIEEMERQGHRVPPGLHKVAEFVEELNRETGLIKPGDASMAAPFTAKHASVLPCADLIMQGRSTLVSTVQMFKILGLMSLANAYALSVMYLQGVKIGDIQVTVVGLLTTGMFLFLSNTQPLTKLSKKRPHPNVLCLYVFISVLAQSLVNMSYLIYLYQCAVAESPLATEEDADVDVDDRKFKPNLVNSVCFLVNFVIQIITFSVNYSGAPFTTPLLENRGLAGCLYVAAGVAFLLTLDIVPGFNRLLEMVHIPFVLRLKILFLGVVDFVTTYALEYVLRFALPAPLPPEKGYMQHHKYVK